MLHRATMSQSTRKIFAFPTFGFNLPLNVLSIIYRNPWISEDCFGLDITLYVPLAETFKLKYTGNAVEAFTPVTTNSTITGGIFGKNLFQLYKLAYFWKTDYLRYIFTLQVNIIYFNTKYKSYHNSLNYPDGIVQLTIPIFANGLIDNPQFNNFEKAFDQVKSDLGKTTCILNKDLVNWFKAEPTGQTYAYYKSSYFDEDTWKNYPCATTVNLPMLPFQHYISCRQFINTFGSLINTSGKPLQNPPPFTIPTSLVGFGWEIKLLEIAG